MKTLLDSILFFGAMGLFVIGIYESMTLGVSDSYWIFMISLSLLFLYGYRKNQNADSEKTKASTKRKPGKGKRK